MFTIDQIKHAHSKVKSGADFPSYIQELIELGLSQYTLYVSDGHTLYSGKNNYSIKSESRYAPMEIAEVSDENTFKQNLKEHQQGKTDFMTFCKQCAETGVERWTVDMEAMTCTYYDKAEREILIEKIPKG